DRCAIVRGNAFDAVPPGCEAYILKNVLMSFDDVASCEALHKVRLVCTEAMRLLVLESVVGPPNEDPRAKFSDLNMLVIPGGSERTREEWTALFMASGFRLSHITPSARGPCVIEGVPA